MDRITEDLFVILFIVFIAVLFFTIILFFAITESKKPINCENHRRTLIQNLPAKCMNYNFNK